MRAVHQADKCLLCAFLAYRNNLIARAPPGMMSLLIRTMEISSADYFNTTSRTDLPCKAEFSPSVTEQI